MTFAVQLLLMASFAAAGLVTYYFGRRAEEAHVSTIARQSLARASARLTGITSVAVSQHEVLARTLQANDGQTPLPEVLNLLAPTFVARPTLAYVGIARAENGEYAMLERRSGGATLRHYLVRADGHREIHVYEPDAAGRMHFQRALSWNGYDPRTRPFYTEAVAAGRPVWTDSYVFRDNDNQPATLGATLAAPWRDASGRLVGVTDVDFDTHSLSVFMQELQRELPGRIFVIENRRDGTFRAVAHSDFVSRVDLRAEDFQREPAVPIVAEWLRRAGAAQRPPEGLLHFQLKGEDYVADVDRVRGDNAPPWFVAVVMPRAAVVADLEFQLRLSWITLGLLAVAAVFGVRLVTRSLASPLARLTGEVASLEPSLARDRPASEQGPEEIVRLARAFNDLAARVRTRQTELAAARETAEENAARLRRANRALRQIAQAIAGRDHTEVWRESVRACAEALDISRTAIWFREPGSRDLRLLAMWDSDAQKFIDNIVVDIEAHPEYWLALQRDGRVATNDAACDVRTARLHREWLKHLPHVALFDSAIRVQGEIVGVFSFHHLHPGRQWSNEDEVLVLGAADLVALELERSGRRAIEASEAARAQRLARQHRALSRAAFCPELRGGQLDGAFRELCLVSTEALDVVRASVWLVRPGENRLWLMNEHDIVRGGHSQGAQIELAQIAGYWSALATGRRVAAADALRDPRTAELVASRLQPRGVAALLDAGIFSRGELVGVVCFEHATATRVWEPEEEIFASAIADLAALALEASARQLAEDEMERSRRRLQLLIDGTPLAAIDWNRQLRIIGWNPAAERMFGRTRAEVLGLDGFWMVSEQDRARLSGAWRELLAGRAYFVTRFENRRADGETVICDWHNTLLRDVDGEVMGVTSLVEDVTDRVRAEEQIRQLNASLEARVAARTAELAAANDKLKELDRLKSEFLATMSHELRTPLNSIIGFTGILKEGMAGPVNDEQRKQLALVYGSARHLLSLINDLLDLSRIEAGRLQLEAKEFAAGAVLRECVESLAPMVRLKALECRVDDRAPGLVLRSDRKRFLQIVMNLANNAVKFTDHGSVVIEIARADDNALLRVTDTGPGIDAEAQARLFRAFSQLDGSARRHHEGTGLGLYLCRKLAHLLGGEIGVESEVGRGSSFWVRLPLVAPFAGRTDNSISPWS